MIRKLLVAVFATAFLVAGHSATAEAKTTLKMATLAPPQSPWGKVFKKWARKVKKRSKGEVEIQWLWNGTGGPERGVVGKIRSGQYAGAAVTGVGLGDIYKPIMALQLPGAFKNWDELDAARKKLGKDFRSALKERGFRILGWGDVGIAHFMSKGFAIAGPTDVRGKSPGVIKGDINSLKLYEAIGGVTPVQGSITEFLPKLNSGAINMLNTPSLAAEQLQWASRLTNVTTRKTYFGIGGLIVSQKVMAALPADQRKIVVSEGRKAAKRLTKKIRGYDAEAYKRIKKKMVVTNPSKAQEAEWTKVFQDTCRKVKTAIPGSVLTTIGAC